MLSASRSPVSPVSPTSAEANLALVAMRLCEPAQRARHVSTGALPVGLPLLNLAARQVPALVEHAVAWQCATP